jgi:hypothetical protein
MKPIYRQHVQEALDRLLPAAFPGFASVPLKLSKEERKLATLFAGSRLYARSVPEGTLFIHLIPHNRQERLQAEVGWSVSGRFPAALTSHGPLTQPADEKAEPSWLIDFSLLYHRKHGLGFLGWDVWKPSVDVEHPDYMRTFMREDLEPVSEEQARQRAEAAVKAALVDLRDVALPYLEEWVESRRTRSEA